MCSNGAQIGVLHSRTDLSATEKWPISAHGMTRFSLVGDSGGFVHGPIDGSFHDATEQERYEFWDELYTSLGLVSGWPTTEKS